MIKRSEISPVGKFNKPHGIGGEISASITISVDALKRCRCIVCDIDGIFVPFFIAGMRPKNDHTVLLTIDGIDNEQRVASLVNKNIYVLRTDYLDSHDNEEEMPVDFFIGFDAIINGNNAGKVAHIDDSTANVLFVIATHDGRTTLIPAVEEFITDINIEASTIEFDVPGELLEL